MKKNFGRILAVLVFSVWAGQASAASITNYVTVGSEQWAQPDDFTSLSWNDINAVCSGSVCSGTLTSDSSTYDMNGWTWAGVNQVNGLFNAYIANDGGTASGYPMSGPSQASETGASGWGWDFIADFDPVFSDTDIWNYNGLMSNVVSSSLGGQGVLQVSFNTQIGDYRQFAGTNGGIPFAVDTPFLGAWFVRETPTSEVPVPATLGLFGLALAGLGWTRRKKA